MKSWYVEYLIMNRFDIACDPENDMDTYGDLKTVLETIKELNQKNLITEKEMEVLKSVPSITSAEKILKIDRNTVRRLLSSACYKVGAYLGDYFTDEGYIDYMKNKYNLTENQLENLKLFMGSRFRFKLMRKQYNAR